MLNKQIMVTGQQSLDVELKGSSHLVWQAATLSVKEGFIMLHSECISAQWPLDFTGVQITNYGEFECYIKVGFHHTGCSTQPFQSFYFNANMLKEIEDFFKSWRFPVPRNEVVPFLEKKKASH